MRKILSTISICCLISINVFSSNSNTIPDNVCIGDDTEYKINISVSSRSLSMFRGASYVLKVYNGTSWEDADADKERAIKSYISPSGGSKSTTATVCVKFGEYLNVGRYRIDMTAYRGVGNTPYSNKVEFNIYDAAEGYSIETDDIEPNATNQLKVCPGENKYLFYIDGISNTDLLWTIDEGSTEISEPETNAAEKEIAFTATDGTDYVIRVNEASGCRVSKTLTIVPMLPNKINGNIQSQNGKTICKEGHENVLYLPQQTWANNYEWKIISGSSYVNILGNGNLCNVDVKSDAGNNDSFSVEVIASDGCYSDNLSSELIYIQDIIAQADYINSATQETEDLKICYNSPNIKINGPIAYGSSPNIISWQWSDGTTGSSLPSVYYDDEDISVRVININGCERTYSFLADVQEAPIIDLPWHHICEDQNIVIDLTDEFSSYPITWEDGSTAKTRSITNPNNSFDETITLQYHQLGSNTCTSDYIQHFEYNPRPEFEDNPEELCFGGSVTIDAPELMDSYQWTNSTDPSENSQEIFYTLTNLERVNEVRLDVEINGCSFDETYLIEVKDQVNLILEGGNNKEVCYGSDIMLTVPDDFTNVIWHNNGTTGNTQLLENVINDMSILVSGEKDGCYAEATITITSLPLPNIALETDKSNYCEGEAFDITLTGTIEGRRITQNDLKMIDWSHGIDYRMVNNLNFENTTEVSCYVIDYNDCGSFAYNTINIADNPTLDMPNQYVCEGKNLFIQTGADYEDYLWYNNSSNSTINLTNVKVPITNAWVKVSDINGCSTTSYFEIQVYDVNNIYIEPINICQGETTTLSAPSGFATYVWNTGETTRSIEVSPSDDFTYSCEVSDGDCNQIIDYEVVVNNSTPFTLDNVFACKDANTTIEGPSGYDSYAWNYEAATTQSLIFKTNTDFTLSLTAWQNGCPHTASAQVVVVEAENFDFEDNSICSGSSISYTAPTGYDYNWSDDSQDGNQTAILSPTETTSYTLEIEDAYGCTSSDEFLVTVNDFIDFNIPDREICRGTTTEIAALPIYTSYLWSTGETTNSINVSPVNSTAYSLTVTDFNGCQGTATSEITVLDNLAISLENKSICTGEYITIGLDNESVDYHSFQWNNGSTQSQQDVSPAQTTSYTLTVEDENGCQATASMQVSVYSPRSIALDPVTICQGQSAEIIAPNNLTEHTWNGILTNQDVHTIDNVQYNSTVNLRARDNNGCLTFASSNILVNRNPVVNISDKNLCKFENTEIHLPEIFASYNWSNGSTESYTNILALENETMQVTVSDGNGCETTESFNVSVYDYTPISLSNQSICKGESAVIGLSGSDWVEQIWSNGKSSQEITESPIFTTDYMVHATDINGCTSSASMTLIVNEPTPYELPNIEICSGETETITADPGFQSYLWSTGETTQSIDLSLTSNELVTVALTDQNGCITTAKKLAVVYLNPEIYLDDYTVCLGNDIDIVAPGGYTYLWNNGNTSRINNVSPVVNTDYTLTAIDGYGCRGSATSSVTVQQPPVISLSSYTICPGEVVNLDGGANFNKYFWSNGVIGRYNTVRPVSDNDYTLTVEDIYGCQASATASVIVHSVTDMSLGAIEACIGDTVNIIAQSGFQSYNWTTGATTRTLRDVLSNYEKIGLTVTDNNGCTQYNESVITSLEKPDYFLAPEYVACEGESVDVNVIPGYLLYTWSDGSYLNNRTFWPTGSTDYSLTVEHVNGCETTKYTTVSASNLTNNYLDDILACHNELVEFTLENSENLSTINWSTGENGSSSIFVKAEKDSVINVDFTDYNGCTGSESAQLLVQPGVSPGLSDITICKGEEITIYPEGVYTSYLWSTGETTPTITVTGENSRTISLEVEDQYGCTYTSSFTLNVKYMPEINLNDLNLCYTDTISIGVVSSPEYSYLWNTGDTTSIISRFVNSDQQFTLTITDRETSCQISENVNINVFPEPELNLSNQFADPGDIIILSIDESYHNINWSTGETTHTITITTDTTEYIYVEAIDANSCRVREEVFIYVSGPEESIVSSDTACSGEACILSARSGYKEYLWSTGETNSYIIAYDSKPKDYQVEITDHSGSVNTFSTKSNIKPGPEINIGDTNICFGDDLTLRIAAGAKSYFWSTGSESNEITFEDVNSNFDYFVQVEGINGCISERSGQVKLHQNKYSIIGLKDVYNKGEQINISISNSEDLKSCMFTIDGIEYNSTSVLTNIYDPGQVEVTFVVQDKNGCYFENTKTITIENSSSTIGIEKDNWLFIYPNPVTNILNIEVGNYSSGYNISFHNSNGELIFNDYSYNDIYKYDLQEYPEGLYIITIITQNNTFNKTLIKQ